MGPIIKLNEFADIGANYFLKATGWLFWINDSFCQYFILHRLLWVDEIVRKMVLT